MRLPIILSLVLLLVVGLASTPANAQKRTDISPLNEDVNIPAAMMSLDRSLHGEIPCNRQFPEPSGNGGLSIDTAVLSIPDTIAEVGESINIPINMESGQSFVSFQFRLAFDPDVLFFDSLSLAGTLSEPWSGWVIFAYDTAAGMVRLAALGLDPISGDGVLAYLAFRVVPTASVGDVSVIDLDQVLFNEGSPPAKAVDGSLTVYSPVETPVLVSPSDGAPDVSRPVALDWDDVSGAVMYEVQVDDDALFGSPEIDDSTTSSDYTTSGLSDTTQYYWRVRACNGSSWSGWSIEWSFTTECPEPSIPDAPSASSTTPCVDSTYTISWNQVSGATAYWLYENEDSIYQGPDTSVDMTRSSGTYIYYVKAGNACGWSANSAEESVTMMELPLQPDTLYCAYDTVKTGEPYVITWDAISGASSYELYENGSSIYVGGDTADTITHSEHGDYLYALKACNECGCSDTSRSLLVTVEPSTAVDDIDSPELPDTYALRQNYPNPFNPETRIEFTLPRSSFVTIAIYNIVGERVRILVSERLSPGPKAVTWYGRDDGDNEISSGIYFYKMTAGEFTESKKMLFLK